MKRLEGKVAVVTGGKRWGYCVNGIVKISNR